MNVTCIIGRIFEYFYYIFMVKGLEVIFGLQLVGPEFHPWHYQVYLVAPVKMGMSSTTLLDTKH